MRNQYPWCSILVVGAATLVLLFAAGAFLVDRSVTVSYSRDWQSASTENAQYRKVFVASPIVEPSRLALNDSLYLAVTDAWVERPTHIEYKWFFARREVSDSGYRVVVHLAQVTRDAVPWTHSLGRGFVNSELRIDGDRPSVSGNAYVKIIEHFYRDVPPDTIRLSILPPGS